MKLSDIFIKEDDDLSFNLDDDSLKDKSKEEKPEEKPEDDKSEKNQKDSPDEEHKHPDTFKDKLLELFQKAKENNSLQAYEKAETVQIRPSNDKEQIQVKYPGSITGPKTTKPGDFVLRSEDDPTLMKIVSKQELEKGYEIENSEAEPDAEGFVKYIPKGQIIAFQYSENEPIKLKNEQGIKITIQYGDYLGYPADDASELIRLDKNHFEKQYRLAA